MERTKDIVITNSWKTWTIYVLNNHFTYGQNVGYGHAYTIQPFMSEANGHLDTTQMMAAVRRNG